MLSDYIKLSTLFFVVVFIIFLLKYIFNLLNKIKRRRNIECQIKNRTVYRQQQFEKLRNDLTHFDRNLVDKIVKWSFRELVDKIKDKKVKIIDVLKSYQLKALEAQEKCNCVCLFIEEANQWAIELENSNKRNLPLFGLPISVKESIAVKGQFMTFGYASHTNYMSVKDSKIVESLKSLGAIPFCITNVPQTLLAYASSNPIYGVTTNPYHSKLLPGGSSGGEAALIACGGSLLGIGSDGGGSVRVPCHFTGICGLKPTASRVSNVGVGLGLPGRQMIAGVVGPMSRDVDTLITFMRAVLLHHKMHAHLLDPYVAPIELREEYLRTDLKPSLRIGYYDNDDWFEPVPTCKRAVEIAVKQLSCVGHQLVPFKMPQIDHVMTMFSKAAFMDKGRFIMNNLAADTFVEPYIKPLFEKLIANHSLTFRTAYNILQLFGQQQILHGFGNGPIDLIDLQSTYIEIANYRQKAIENWQEAELDALICPAFGIPAVAYEFVNVTHAARSYSMLFNLLDWPAGIIPICKVSRDDQEQLLKDPDIEKSVKQACGNEYQIGLSVGVQIVTLPFQDELCLRIMKEIETQLKLMSLI